MITLIGKHPHKKCYMSTAEHNVLPVAEVIFPWINKFYYFETRVEVLLLCLLFKEAVLINIYTF